MCKLYTKCDLVVKDLDIILKVLNLDLLAINVKKKGLNTIINNGEKYFDFFEF